MWDGATVIQLNYLDAGWSPLAARTLGQLIWTDSVHQQDKGLTAATCTGGGSHVDRIHGSSYTDTRCMQPHILQGDLNLAEHILWQPSVKQHHHTLPSCSL